MTKQERIQHLIKKYKEAEQKNKPHNTDPISCLSRDTMRKIRQIFEKEMHDSIDKYL